MNQRVVLYGDPSGLQALLRAAEFLGFKVASVYISENIWDPQSAVLDFLHSSTVLVPEQLKKVQLALKDIAVASFDDLNRVTMADVWRAVIPAGKESFRVLLEGMRHVGATFKDWDMKPGRPLSEEDGFTKHAFSKLRQAGADDTAVFNRLENRDIELIAQLGKKSMDNIMQVRQTL